MGGRGVRSGRGFRCGRGDHCSPSVDPDGIVSAAAADLVQHLRPVLSETWNSRRCPRTRTWSSHRWTPRACVSGSNLRIVVVVVCICNQTWDIRVNNMSESQCIWSHALVNNGQRHTHRTFWNTPCGLSSRAYVIPTGYPGIPHAGYLQGPMSHPKHLGIPHAGYLWLPTSYYIGHLGMPHAGYLRGPTSYPGHLGMPHAGYLRGSISLSHNFISADAHDPCTTPIS